MKFIMGYICFLKTILILVAIQSETVTCQNGTEATATATPAQAIFTNISYGTDPQQVMDVYLPAGRNDSVTKVIVLIHGGGWSGGNKEGMGFLIPVFYYTFPQHAIVNINYRLATIASPAWPKQILDVYAALQFLKSKAAEYSYDPSFGLVGASAGAHLSMLYGYGYDAAKDVKVICNLVGPTNLIDPNVIGNPTLAPIILNLVGNVTYAQNPWLYYLVSPAAYVNASSPRTISFYGDQDPLIPNSQGETLEDKLDSAGVYNKYYLYPGGGHGTFTPAQNAHMFKKLMYFFKNYL